MTRYIIFFSLWCNVSHAQMHTPRVHKVTQSKELKLISATQSIDTKPQVTIKTTNNYRIIKANGIPSHSVGSFPNAANPNEISEQSYSYQIPLSPTVSEKKTPLEMSQNFGIAVNGVPFDPAADEWYMGERGSWRYEALSGAIELGVDENHAHVQPNGAYHYHGLPTKLLNQLNVKEGSPSPIIGWAADGFPIYALYDNQGQEVKSSYRLKKGTRPSTDNQPGGKYDGTFVDDYEFVSDLSPLDECNGMMINGTYAYFLTRSYPVIPRCFAGTADQSFQKKPSRGRNHNHGKRRSHTHPPMPPPGGGGPPPPRR